MVSKNCTSFQNFNFPGSESLLGGNIGKLAMDIAKDINVNDLDLGDPTKLLGSIMSGNLQENPGLMNLFGNITNKIKTKMDTGDLDTDVLHKEAAGILNNKQSINRAFFQCKSALIYLFKNFFVRLDQSSYLLYENLLEK